LYSIVSEYKCELQFGFYPVNVKLQRDVTVYFVSVFFWPSSASTEWKVECLCWLQRQFRQNKPKLDFFLKINLLQKYFIWLTLFSRAIHGGAAVKCATPLSVAWLGEPCWNRLSGGARVA
jgi:hypothetical protein